jgi:hypothetical protein
MWLTRAAKPLRSTRERHCTHAPANPIRLWLRTAGHLSVAYFIVCVLWRVGLLKEALEKAKRDLSENEQKVFGLSNVLMLLNSLLKFRHADFTNQMLDDIERLTHGLNEHTFLIPAKIAAIRASRL